MFRSLWVGSDCDLYWVVVWYGCFYRVGFGEMVGWWLKGGGVRWGNVRWMEWRWVRDIYNEGVKVGIDECWDFWFFIVM